MSTPVESRVRRLVAIAAAAILCWLSTAEAQINTNPPIPDRDTSDFPPIKRRQPRDTTRRDTVRDSYAIRFEAMVGFFTPVDQVPVFFDHGALAFFYQNRNLRHWWFGLYYGGYAGYMFKGDGRVVSPGSTVSDKGASIIAGTVRFHPVKPLYLYVRGGISPLDWDSTKGGRTAGSAVLPVGEFGVGGFFSKAIGIEVGILQGLSSITFNTGEQVRLRLGALRLTVGISSNDF